MEQVMPKRVRDVMKAEVVKISPEATAPEIQREFLRARVGALPVVASDGRLQGIVSRSDIVRQQSVEQSLAELASSGIDADLSAPAGRLSLDSIGEAVGRRLARLRARDLMIRDVVTVSPDDSLAEAAHRMLDRRIHRLPVVEEGRLVGILSAFDFVTLYAERVREESAREESVDAR